MTGLMRMVPLLIAVLVMGITGCGEKRAKVSGKVTYNDKVLTGGTVNFVTKDNLKGDTATIQPDGTYSCTNVPFGDLLVAVRPAVNLGAKIPKGTKIPEVPPDSPAAGVYAKKGDNITLPKHLQDTSTSKITLTVDKSDQTFDITLTDK
jgi:hypothetical protein